MEKYQEIERNIIKKYRKDIWCKFTKAIRDYNLIKDNDKIMVCISGGKDSFLMAKCFQEIKRHGKIDFDVYYVVMNPGYTKEHLNLIKENAKILNIPVEIFNSDIFLNVNVMDAKSPCYMCARMRRGHLYNKAQELGCNKIALGHHFDDVIETNLLSMLYSAEIKTMMPKLHSENFECLELIRPMYYIREKDIIAWAKYHELKFLNCACKMTIESSIDEEKSKRKEIKKLINALSKVNPYIEYNIFKSMENINLTQILGYKKDNYKYSFLDNYDKYTEDEK
ncbi:MAG: tRNA 2-thiocytidine biosynthesis protein TtcA [Ruminococcus sp.]|nr:tRNA 2-thiocytidine biosynthesis protein TtcA [Ruminococcus sp.]